MFKFKWNSEVSSVGWCPWERKDVWENLATTQWRVSDVENATTKCGCDLTWLLPSLRWSNQLPLAGTLGTFQKWWRASYRPTIRWRASHRPIKQCFLDYWESDQQPVSISSRYASVVKQLWYVAGFLLFRFTSERTQAKRFNPVSRSQSVWVEISSYKSLWS